MARRLSRPALEQRAATLGPRPRGDPRNGGRVCGGGGGESKDGIVYTPTARRGLFMLRSYSWRAIHLGENQRCSETVRVSSLSGSAEHWQC